MKKKLRNYKKGGLVNDQLLPKFKFGIGSFASFMKNGNFNMEGFSNAFGSSGGNGGGWGNIINAAAGAVSSINKGNSAQSNASNATGVDVAAPKSSLVDNEYATNTEGRGRFSAAGAQNDVNKELAVLKTVGDASGETSYIENTPGIGLLSKAGQHHADKLANSATGGSGAQYRGAAMMQTIPQYAATGEKWGAKFGPLGRVVGGTLGAIVGVGAGALDGNAMRAEVKRQILDKTRASDEAIASADASIKTRGMDEYNRMNYKCGGKFKFKYGGEKPHSNNPNALVDHKEVMMNPDGEIQKAVGHNSSQIGKDDQIPVSLENGTRILSDSLGVGNRSFADMASNLSKINSKARKVLDDRSVSPIDRKTAELNLRASIGAFDKLYAAQEDQKMIAGIKSATKFKYGGKKLPKYVGGTEGEGTGNPLGLKLSIMDTVPQNQGGTIAPGASPIRPYSDEFNGIEDLSNKALVMDYNVDDQRNYYTSIDHPDWFRAGVLRFADALNRAGKFANFSPGNEMVVNTNVNDFNNTIKAGNKFYTSNDFATPERNNYSTYAMYQPAVSTMMNSATFKKYYPDGKINYKEAGAKGKFDSMLDELMYGMNTSYQATPTDNTMLKSQDKGVNTNGIKFDENGYFPKPNLNVQRPEEPDDPVEDPNKPTGDDAAKSRELLTRGDAGLYDPTVDNSKLKEEDDDKTPGNENKNPEDLTWEQLMNGGWEDPHQYDNEEGAYIRYHQAKANEPVEEINPRKYDMGKVTPGSYNRWSDDANLRKMQAAAVQAAASRGGGGSNAANAIAASLGFAGKQADIAAAKQRYDAAQIQEANRVNTEIERQNVTNRMKVDEMNMRSRARREDHAAQAAELRSKNAQARKSDAYKARMEYIDGLTQFAGAARYMNEGELKMYMDALNRAFSSTGPGGYNARVASDSNSPTYKMSDETKAKLKKGADKAKAGVKKASGWLGRKIRRGMSKLVGPGNPGQQRINTSSFDKKFNSMIEQNLINSSKKIGKSKKK